jgi:hypothetical protein
MIKGKFYSGVVVTFANFSIKKKSSATAGFLGL